MTQQPTNSAAYQNLLSFESQLDVMLSKARAAASPTPGTGEAAATPDTIPDTPDPIAEKLSRVQCGIARALTYDQGSYHGNQRNHKIMVQTNEYAVLSYAPLFAGTADG